MTEIRRISNYNPILLNRNKKHRLVEPFELYKSELQHLVNKLLYQPNVKPLLGKEYTDSIPFPARLSQVVAKQASSIIRSIQSKVAKAQKSGNREKYQDEILNKWNNRSLTIDINSVNIELDSRFVDIQSATNTEICDYWIKITSFPSKSFYVPLKLTNHMKELTKRGFRLKTNALRLNSDGTLGFYFLKESNTRTGNRSIGIDIGRNKVIMTSNGTGENTHVTGKLTKDLLNILYQKKQGSRNSKQTKTNIKHQINWSLKHDIPWNNIDQLIIERLTDMKRYNKWGKKSHNWRVGYIQAKIQKLCEENDVRLTRINPAYTSQECSACGHRHRNNRSGEKFSCRSCGHEMDADYNAAINIHRRGANSTSFVATSNHI